MPSLTLQRQIFFFPFPLSLMAVLVISSFPAALLNPFHWNITTDTIGIEALALRHCGVIGRCQGTGRCGER